MQNIIWHPEPGILFPAVQLHTRAMLQTQKATTAYIPGMHFGFAHNLQFKYWYQKGSNNWGFFK